MALYKFLIVVAFLVGNSACGPSNSKAIQENGGSQLATIKFPKNLSTDLPGFYEWLGGEDNKCPNFNGGCQAALQLVGQYAIAIKPVGTGTGTCTNLAFTKANDKSDQAETAVATGCRYNVELGYYKEAVQTGSPAFLIFGSGELDVPKGATNVEVKITLNATDEGVRLGFPKASGVNSSANASLEIKAEFGNSNGGGEFIDLTMEQFMAEMLAASNAGNNKDLILRDMYKKYERKRVRWEALVVNTDFSDQRKLIYFIAVYNQENVAELQDNDGIDPRPFILVGLKETNPDLVTRCDRGDKVIVEGEFGIRDFLNNAVVTKAP